MVASALTDVRRSAPDESCSVALQQAVRLIEDAASTEQVVALVRTNARRLIGADGIAVILRDGDKCHYVEEDAIAPLWKGRKFPARDCVSGWAMINRQTALIPDILVDRRVPQDAYRTTFVRSMAMAPMGTSDPQGAIGAYWANAHALSSAEVATLERLAAAAGRALGRRSGGALAEREGSVLEPASRWGFSRMTDPRRWLLGLLPSKPLAFWKGQLLALTLVTLVAVARTALTPWVGNTSIFTAFVPAILICALWAGPASGAAAVILSTVAGAAIGNTLLGEQRGWMVFAPVGAIVVLVAASVRTALDQQRTRADVLEDRDHHLASITRELDHRSRNTLAVVAALTQQACNSSTTAVEMRDKLNAHFKAMAAAQALLLEVGQRGVRIRDLLNQVLAPFISEKRVVLDVDETLEAPNGCEVMLSLAFSELATNACKYGALLNGVGEVHVVGRRAGSEIRLIWSESGGPKVAPPERSSTGTRLIAKALAGAGGRLEASYLPAGLVCEFTWSDGRR